MSNQISQDIWKQQVMDFLKEVEEIQKEVITSSIHLLANAMDDIHQCSKVPRARVATEVFQMTLGEKKLIQLLGGVIIGKEKLSLMVSIAKLSGCWLEWDSENSKWIPISLDLLLQRHLQEVQKEALDES